VALTKKTTLKIRFSLLTAGVVVSLLAIGLGIWANRAHRQRRAVLALRGAGAKVLYASDRCGGFTWNQDTSSDASAPWWRDFWLDVVVVDAHQKDSSFSDLEMAVLADLPGLETLNAGWTQVTSRGVPYLRKSPRLKHLNLESTGVDDSSIRHIAALVELESLVLTRTRVSEEGLSKLGGHRRLRSLAVSNTRLTRQGFERLQASLPNCQISYQPQKPVKGPPKSDGGVEAAVQYELSQYALPERTLTQKELDYFFETADILIRKRPVSARPTENELQRHASDRSLAAREIGKELRHVCVIPVLAAVVRDRTEEASLRSFAASSLAHIPDPCSVEVLIEALPEGGSVGCAAEFALASLTDVVVGRKKDEQIDQNPTPEEGLLRQKLWRAWWDKHGPSIKLRGQPHAHRYIPSEEEWLASQGEQGSQAPNTKE
jgi:hypothetical protein